MIDDEVVEAAMSLKFGKKGFVSLKMDMVMKEAQVLIIVLFDCWCMVMNNGVCFHTSSFFLLNNS